MSEISQSIYKRIENEINAYLSNKIELSEGVFFSQYKLINRIYKFKNRDLAGSKINSDLSYNYYFDIISPRRDSEVKNLRFDTKHILAFSRNPRLDFPAVFIANASLKSWMAENGEDDKLKDAIEEFSSNGNVIFKKVDGGYETTNPLETVVTNQTAKTIDDTDLIERHDMTASQIMQMEGWENKEDVIEYCGNNFFKTSEQTTQIETSGKRYEIYEFTGEVSEKEFNEISEVEGGDENNHFLAKIVCAGLRKNHTGEKYTLFVERLKGKNGKKAKMSDYFIDAHRSTYDGRFWRVGMIELLMDQQIRANEIGNQLAQGLEWASKVVFKSNDAKVLQNIRADIDNGDVLFTSDLQQVDVRMRGLDQLIADWNRNLADANQLSNSQEVVRGEALPSGTPFRSTALLDQNAGKLFTLIRQKLTMPFKRVFREWVLPELLKELSGKDIFRLTGDNDLLDQLREIMVESWYVSNLVHIGPHSREIAEAIKAEKLDELRNVEPVIKNTKEIWKGVMPRLFITITGENSDINDQIQDLLALLNVESDPDRIAWILDTIYKSRNIPIPPKKEQEPAETQLPGREPTGQTPGGREAQQPVVE